MKLRLISYLEALENMILARIYACALYPTHGVPALEL